MNPTARPQVRLRLSRTGTLVAAAAGSLVVLALVYAVAGRFTTAPGAIAPGDAPALTAVTRTETIVPTRDAHRTGAAATRVRLPAAVGTQGATFAYYPGRPQALRASMWLHADAGREYVLVATNQAGSERAAGRYVTATGDWQHLTLRIAPTPGDSVVYLSIIRTRRGGAETFDVDDVHVAPASSGPAR